MKEICLGAAIIVVSMYAPFYVCLEVLSHYSMADWWLLPTHAVVALVAVAGIGKGIAIVADR